MKFVLFCHSLVSDWNHGNAHFLRGVCSELDARGHCVEVYEPENGWSLRNLLEDQGPAAVSAFHRVYPQLRSHFYDPATLDLDRVLDGADVVIVHEWNDPQLVQRVGRHVAGSRCAALFHDTHHRIVSDPQSLARLDLANYAGVLAFGEVIRRQYLERGWIQHAWTWHEAADVRRFHPRSRESLDGDLVWIGNWGDDERTQELHEFLLEPVAALNLSARIYGVRYPDAVRRQLTASGISYAGWLANYSTPEVYAKFGCTVHVPRRAYARLLPGIPTIRMFEALACGIPLVSAPWEDCEALFDAGSDYLVARNGAEMRTHLQTLRTDRAFAERLAKRGAEVILQRHTCAHRVNELLEIVAALRRPGSPRMTEPRVYPLQTASPLQ
jgi:spore maturation protein CgeB